MYHMHRLLRSVCDPYTYVYVTNIITLSNMNFGPHYPLGKSCIVFRPERESASRIALSPSVFEKIEFEKNSNFLTLNIFCVETVIVIRLLIASNYSMNPPECNAIIYYCNMNI